MLIEHARKNVYVICAHLTPDYVCAGGTRTFFVLPETAAAAHIRTYYNENYNNIRHASDDERDEKQLVNNVKNIFRFIYIPIIHKGIIFIFAPL